MSNTLKASMEGLAIVDRARLRRGWTKTCTARWWEDAHTSKATLRRFWQGDRIGRDIFIAICQVVGISNWEAIADSSDIAAPDTLQPITYLDWDDAPDVKSFYGRDRELSHLEQWMTTDGCKLIAIVGIGGIGKTALALASIDRIRSNFDCLIWRSLSSAPALISLLDSILNALDRTVVADVRQGITQLIHHLQQRRSLLILDGLDAVLSNKEYAIEYEEFLEQLSRDRHQSCIVITSREKPLLLEIESKTIRSLTLNGLPNSDALKLLQSRGFTGNELGRSALIRLYRGNPLAIELVTPLIQSVFGGNIAAFLNQNTVTLGDRLRAIFKQQFDRLSDLERDILYWLAIWQEPVSFCRLQTHFIISLDPAAILVGIVNLEARSLLEKWVGAEECSFTLQPLVMKVVTDELVEVVAGEIDRVVESKDLSYFKVLRTHWLLRPGTDDIAGDRILNQLREKLWRLYGATLPEIIGQILWLLQDRTPLAIGYIACNLNAVDREEGRGEREEGIGDRG